MKTKKIATVNKVYDYIALKLSIGHSPTLVEIAKKVKRSDSTVHQHVKNLIALKWLKRDKKTKALKF